MGVVNEQSPRSHLRRLRMRGLCILVLGGIFLQNLALQNAYAQSVGDLSQVGGGVYYDAREVQLNQRDGSVVLSGDVLFFSGESFLKSEQLIYYPDKGIAIAEGRVAIFHNKERIRAERVVARIGTQELFAEKVWLSVDPKATTSAKDFNEKILGFTEEEVAFESLRLDREKDLMAELSALRDTYASRRSLLSVTRDPVREAELQKDMDNTKSRYAQILGRLTRTRYQPNLFLEGLSEDEQSRLEKRRETVKRFVQDNRDIARQIATRQTAPGYIALTAGSLHRRPDGKMEAREARMTPCRCDVDEIALWGLSTSEALVDPGEYATLYGATVDITDIPAFYIPFLKFPIKSQRESGFLLPSVYVSRSGQIVSIPYFQTLGPHADATLTIDDFSSRGTRAGLEFRGVVTESAQTTLSAELIEDKKRTQEYKRESLEQQIDENFASNEFKAAKLKDEIGTINATRWQTSGKLNIPYRSVAAAKADWVFVSDNEYLSDFSVDSESKSDLFEPAQSTFRFLPQEVAGEYYGKETSLSIRVQRFRDLVSPLSDKIPYRAPKAEFSLFPQRIFESRFHFDQQVSWENIARDDELSFLDKYTAATLPQGGGADASEKLPIVNYPDGKRTPNEAFVTGQRFFSQSRLSVPLLVNPWLMSTAHVRGVTTAYQFETGEPYNRQRPRMSYVSYEVENRSVMELERPFAQNDAGEGLFIASRQSPFVNLNYVPQVARDPNFPGYYDVFYEADNFVPKRTVTFGIEGNLSWGRMAFEKTERPLARFPGTRAPSPANFDLLSASLVDAGFDSLSLAPEGQARLFEATKDLRFSSVLDSWASSELDTYFYFVLKQDFGETLQWPEPPFYSLERKVEGTPLTYSLQASYNFDVEATQDDILNRLRPGDTTERIDVWGDVIGSFTANARPFLPITFSTTLNWSPWRKSFYKGTSSVGVQFPFNLSVSVINSFETYEAVSRADRTEQTTFVKRSIGINANLRPKPWLLFTFQRKQDLDTQLPPPVKPEWGYESLQKISFLNLQECLDIELTRYKKTAVDERYATWAIGLNLKFLGQTRPISNLGDSLNRSIQARQIDF